MNMINVIYDLILLLPDHLRLWPRHKIERLERVPSRTSHITTRRHVNQTRARASSKPIDRPIRRTRRAKNEVPIHIRRLGASDRQISRPWYSRIQDHIRCRWVRRVHSDQHLLRRVIVPDISCIVDIEGVACSRHQHRLPGFLDGEVSVCVARVL